jgi:hypothetical protein
LLNTVTAPAPVEGSIHQANTGSLSGARRTYQAEYLLGVHFKAQFFDGRLIAESFADILHDHNRLLH